MGHVLLTFTVKTVAEVTGGKGTLKRKRQIRELLQNHDAEYKDDLFDATPFKDRKKKVGYPLTPQFTWTSDRSSARDVTTHREEVNQSHEECDAANQYLQFWVRKLSIR